MLVAMFCKSIWTNRKNTWFHLLTMTVDTLFQGSQGKIIHFKKNMNLVCIMKKWRKHSLESEEEEEDEEIDEEEIEA